VSRSCQRATARLGRSTNRSAPPGHSTRRISASARTGAPTLQNVEVIATLSTERSYLLGEEKLFLAAKIHGSRCRHELIRIDYSNRFSDRV
jgi:hypothetical protein